MQGVVERKTTIPVLSHLLLTARKDRLNLAATDLDVSLTSSCEADIKEEGAIAVQAKKFVRSSAPWWARRCCSSRRSRGCCRSVPASRASRSTVSPPRTSPACRRWTRSARSRSLPGLQADDLEGPLRRLGEESRFQLNGALLKLKTGAVEMVATDGHRLALVEDVSRGGSRRIRSSCRGRPSRRSSASRGG